MTFSTFLFCDPISPERLHWFAETLMAFPAENPLPGNTTVFLTGDALFSIVDAKTRDTWRTLADRPGMEIVADGDELQLHGLLDLFVTDGSWVTVSGSERHDPFWNALVSTLATGWNGTKRAAFLLCDGPYMNRITVYMTRFLRSVQAAGLHPELYSYLDGVHTLHNGQRPSEFENIGRSIADISASAVQAGKDPWFAACSRCATARGYYQMNPGTGFCEPASAIDEIVIRPLKEILSRFSGHHPIISHACGGIVADKGAGMTIPRLVVFITHPPYCLEWTFGGLSLALAAAMDGIPTTVIFIEEGVYALVGNHVVPPKDKVFNVQEMIAVTIDINDLEYLVYDPSLRSRGIECSPDFSPIARIQNKDLARLLWSPEQERAATRMIFF